MPSSSAANGHSDSSPTLPETIWARFKSFCGWHSSPVLDERAAYIAFLSLRAEHRALLDHEGAIPHRTDGPGGVDTNDCGTRAQYELTYLVRNAIRPCHIRTSSDQTEDYPPDVGLFVSTSETYWLLMNRDRNLATHEKQIDFPVRISLTPAVPIDGYSYRPQTWPEGDPRILNLYDPPPLRHSWPIGFTERSESSTAERCFFDRAQHFARMQIPDIVGQFGEIWVERGKPDVRNRLMFRKVSSDADVGILVWPKFPHDFRVHFLHPHRAVQTPRIPVYQNEVIELADSDRFMIFPSPRRGLWQCSLQIKVQFQWASTIWPSSSVGGWAPNRYQYPNPLERYSHCVQQPIVFPVDSNRLIQYPQNEESGEVSEATCVERSEEASSIPTTSEHGSGHTDLQDADLPPTCSSSKNRANKKKKPVNTDTPILTPRTSLETPTDFASKKATEVGCSDQQKQSPGRSNEKANKHEKTSAFNPRVLAKRSSNIDREPVRPYISRSAHKPKLDGPSERLRRASTSRLPLFAAPTTRVTRSMSAITPSQPPSTSNNKRKRQSEDTGPMTSGSTDEPVTRRTRKQSKQNK